MRNVRVSPAVAGGGRADVTARNMAVVPPDGSAAGELLRIDAHAIDAVRRTGVQQVAQLGGREQAPAQQGSVEAVQIGECGDELARGARGARVEGGDIAEAAVGRVTRVAAAVRCGQRRAGAGQ